MPEVEVQLPAIQSLQEVIVRTGLLTNLKDAAKAIKAGEIYVQVLPESPSHTYWVRYQKRTDGFIVITTKMRIKFRRGDEERTAIIAPHRGRDLSGDGVCTDTDALDI